MKKLSTGQDSTLGNYLMLCNAIFGKSSPQADFIQRKIDAATVNGANEEVIAAESQMIYLLGSLSMRKTP